MISSAFGCTGRKDVSRSPEIPHGQHPSLVTAGRRNSAIPVKPATSMWSTDLWKGYSSLIALVSSSTTLKPPMFIYRPRNWSTNCEKGSQLWLCEGSTPRDGQYPTRVVLTVDVVYILVMIWSRESLFRGQLTTAASSTRAQKEQCFNLVYIS